MLTERRNYQMIKKIHIGVVLAAFGGLFLQCEEESDDMLWMLALAGGGGEENQVEPAACAEVTKGQNDGQPVYRVQIRALSPEKCSHDLQMGSNFAEAKELQLAPFEGGIQVLDQINNAVAAGDFDSEGFQPSDFGDHLCGEIPGDPLSIEDESISSPMERLAKVRALIEMKWEFGRQGFGREDFYNMERAASEYIAVPDVVYETRQTLSNRPFRDPYPLHEEQVQHTLTEAQLESAVQGEEEMLTTGIPFYYAYDEAQALPIFRRAAQADADPLSPAEQEELARASACVAILREVILDRYDNTFVNVQGSGGVIESNPAAVESPVIPSSYCEYGPGANPDLQCTTNHEQYTAPMTVRTVNPAPRAERVDTRSAIAIDFSHDVDPSTVDRNTIYLLDLGATGEGTPQEIDINVDVDEENPRRVLIQPEEELGDVNDPIVYAFRATDSLRSNNGNELVATFSSVFTTETKEPEPTNLELTTISPANGASDVSVTTEIVLEFEGSGGDVDGYTGTFVTEIDPDSAVGSVTLEHVGSGANIPVDIQVSENRIVARPEENLMESGAGAPEEYSFQVSTSIKDRWGNELGGSLVVHSFTTEQDSPPEYLQGNHCAQIRHNNGRYEVMMLPLPAAVCNWGYLEGETYDEYLQGAIARYQGAVDRAHAVASSHDEACSYSWEGPIFGSRWGSGIIGPLEDYLSDLQSGNQSKIDDVPGVDTESQWNSRKQETIFLPNIYMGWEAMWFLQSGIGSYSNPTKSNDSNTVNTYIPYSDFNPRDLNVPSFSQLGPLGAAGTAYAAAMLLQEGADFWFLNFSDGGECLKGIRSRVEGPGAEQGGAYKGGLAVLQPLEEIAFQDDRNSSATPLFGNTYCEYGSNVRSGHGCNNLDTNICEYTGSGEWSGDENIVGSCAGL